MSDTGSNYQSFEKRIRMAMDLIEQLNGSLVRFRLRLRVSMSIILFKEKKLYGNMGVIKPKISAFIRITK